LSVHVFIGPTLSAATVARLSPGAVVHPPVQHGDLLRLRLGRGDVAVIVDGYYHHAGSVRHKEILALIAAGARVVGCSSMGALRAAELYPYGMVGNGTVFEMYCQGVIDADDEVAIAHMEAPEYRTLTVPLVGLRCAADAARRAGVLGVEDAAAVVERARSLPYTGRTWHAIGQSCPAAVSALHSFLSEHPEHADVKATDAVDTLTRLATLVEVAAGPRGAWLDSHGWRTRFLYQWQVAFEGAAVEGIHVDDRAVAQFRQIYDDDLPRRWRRYVLRRMIEAPRTDVETGSLELGALVTAARHGVTPASVTPDQRAAWLTRPEIDELSPEQALLAILVRSYNPALPGYELVDCERDTLTDPATRWAVAECYAINAEVATWQSGHDVDYLTRDVLRGHLTGIWHCPDADDALVAAARDRGFPSLDEAVEAVRPLFLRSRFASLDSTAPAHGTHGTHGTGDA
jgi:hypothetical protein